MSPTFGDCGKMGTEAEFCGMIAQEENVAG